MFVILYPHIHTFFAMKKPTNPAHELVLLVDDEDIDNIINERLLQANYFARSVKTATSVNYALAYLKGLLADAGEIPSVIFLDLNLPLVTGFDFLKEFELLYGKNEALKKTSIVILSSYVTDYQERILAAYGFVVAVLNKPLNEETLYVLQEKIVNGWALTA